MWLVEVIRLPLLVVDLVVEDKKKLICSWVVHLCEVGILEESVLEHLSENVFLKELIILSLEDFDFPESIFLLGALIDSV